MPLRYVVLRHSDVSEPHFDLMFETLPGSMLATWRFPHWPSDTPAQITRLRDHRRLYLEYEGTLTDQRGSVHRVADGTCSVDIGESSVWTIKLLSGCPPQTLIFRKIEDQQWEASAT